jgi:hypothetical protein
MGCASPERDMTYNRALALILTDTDMKKSAAIYFYFQNIQAFNKPDWYSAKSYEIFNVKFKMQNLILHKMELLANRVPHCV